jgi:hypothetical protein
MTTILVIIGLTALFTPLLVWLDRHSISSEEFQSVEDWHNFQSALKKGKK